MAVGFFEAFVKIWQNCWVEWEKNGPTKTFLTDFINEVSIYGFISTKDVLLTLSLGVFFTILRYLLTVAVFKVRLSWNNSCRIVSNRPRNICSCIAVVWMQCFNSKRTRFGTTLVAIVVTWTFDRWGKEFFARTNRAKVTKFNPLKHCKSWRCFTLISSIIVIVELGLRE